MIDLRSDNTAAACPEVIEALRTANDGRSTGYGDDQQTARLRDRIRELFDHDGAEVFPVITGTAANALSLAALCPPWGAVLCHHSAHIANHEGGATSHLSGGATLAPLAGDDGRIDPAALRDLLEATRWGDPHQSQPAVLSLVNATDLGTVLTPDETGRLVAIAAQRGLRAHLDGARLANALATTGCTPADLTWRAEIGACSLGLTKTGGLNADVIVSFDSHVADELRYRAKRAGHVPSKMRYLAAQILALLDGDRWLDNARHANRMAADLGAGLASIGIRPIHPVQANLVFVPLTPAHAARIRAAGVEFYELQPGVGRLVASWQTTPAEVAAAIETVARTV